MCISTLLYAGLLSLAFNSTLVGQEFHVVAHDVSTVIKALHMCSTILIHSISLDTAISFFIYQVLACAPSNVAVDNLVEKLLKGKVKVRALSFFSYRSEPFHCQSQP